MPEKPVPETKDIPQPARNDEADDTEKARPGATGDALQDEATPGLGENQAGFVKSPDLAPGSRRQP